MPNYASHLILNFLALSGMYLLYVQHPFLTTIQLFLFIVGFFVGTVYLSPDIDTKSESSRRCGVLCLPYRKTFSHRGISHHWLWGTVTRIIYVLILIGLMAGLIFILNLPLPNITGLQNYPLELLMLVVGIFIANIIHTVTDRLL